MFWSAENEHPRLTNLEIIFEEFQPMWSRYLNATERRTDRQLAAGSNTALCIASRGKNRLGLTDFSGYNRPVNRCSTSWVGLYVGLGQFLYMGIIK